ncbi:MAG TPA: helix-turn-helix domain-containing protein [Ktedonobacterales bacterium]|nr:helix-turn-helix domain-containing protein [Ktedonobacterales bacterium]
MPNPPNLPGPSWLSGMPSFGEQLHQYRQVRGMTLEQLAAGANVPVSTLSAIESGARLPLPESVVNMLAKTLGLTGSERSTFVGAGKLLALPSLSSLTSLLGGEKPQPPLEAAILVFLIADVRGYTRFTQEHGDTEAARLASKFAGIARAATEQWGGRLLELRGDEALAVFASARKALVAALDMQTRFTEATDADPDLPLYAGIGLDVGEAAPVEDGYRGAALNRAARLCSLAGAGEVLVSAGLAYLVPKPERAAYLQRGSVELKGFDGPTGVLLLAQAPEAQSPLLLTGSEGDAGNDAGSKEI